MRQPESLYLYIPVTSVAMTSYSCPKYNLLNSDKLPLVLVMSRYLYSRRSLSLNSCSARHLFSCDMPRAPSSLLLLRCALTRRLCLRVSLPGGSKQGQAPSILPQNRAFASRCERVAGGGTRTVLHRWRGLGDVSSHAVPSL